MLAVFLDIMGMEPSVLPAPSFRIIARPVPLELHAEPAPRDTLEPSVVLVSQAITLIAVLALFAQV